MIVAVVVLQQFFYKDNLEMLKLQQQRHTVTNTYIHVLYLLAVIAFFELQEGRTVRHEKLRNTYLWI